MRALPLVLSLILVSCVKAPEPVPASEWNDEQIAWRSWEEGAAEAKRTGKPLCLVFFATWCSHCHIYAKVFHDERVVRQAKDFVMVRLDKDRHEALSRRYLVDGDYVPRTFFLRPNGTVRPEIHAGRDTYRYFFDEDDPRSLLGGMQQALAR